MSIPKTHKKLDRIKTYSVDEIFDFLRKSQFALELHPHGKVRKKYYIDSDGNKMSVRRAKVFFEKGTECRCGLKGSFFALEKWRDGGFHLDLYAKDEAGDDVLMTIDHVVPQSKGGRNSLKNYEPMCKVCNEEKADKI